MKDKYSSILPASEQKKACSRFRDKDDYDAELLEAQTGLLELQRKLIKKKRKIVIVFEGQDTAGKGGVLRRMATHLDPRSFLVHPTGKPTDVEAGQHYWQRFFAKFPNPGEIVAFDRSWYGRVLVERVEGFAKKSEWERAYEEINFVERMLTDDGVLVLKYLLDISFEEQGRRFKEREGDPLKSWKLTPEDYRNRRKWKDYQKAFHDMLERTQECPWLVVPSDSKWYSRVTIIDDIVKRSKKFF